MTVFRAPDDYTRWSAVAALIHRSFAYMTPLLEHPARAMEVTPDNLKFAAGQGSGWLVEIDNIPVACLFTRPSRDFNDALYLGWLAVDRGHRRRGYTQALVDAAEQEARQSNFGALTLETGRELVDLHGLFQHMGFQLLAGTGAVIRFRKTVTNTSGQPR